MESVELDECVPLQNVHKDFTLLASHANLRSSEDDPKTSLNQHQSLSGEILPHFDINNLFVAQKLKKLEKGPFRLEL